MADNQVTEDIRMIVGDFLDSIGYVIGSTSVKIDTTLETDALKVVESWGMGIEKDPAFVRACKVGYFASEVGVFSRI